MTRASSNDVRKALGFDTTQYNFWCAVHEAGHTISTLALGGHIRYVEIRRGPDGLVDGGVSVDRRSHDVRFLPVLHAGIEAQQVWMEQTHLWTPRRMDIVRASSRHDLEVIERLAPASAQQEKNAAHARQHVTQKWKKTLRIAAALVEHGRLSARAVRRL